MSANRFPIGAQVRYLGSVATVICNSAICASGSGYLWVDVLIIAWIDITGRYNEVEVPREVWDFVEIINLGSPTVVGQQHTNTRNDNRIP